MEINKGTLRLNDSVSVSPQKIIDIYGRLRSGTLIVDNSYQRKLVWKKLHKLNFIDTILQNYPFPEVYFAPGSLDQEKLILIDEIVDGQQRLRTIQDYIEGIEIFASPKLPIKRFSELTVEERHSFLNYDISVRYLKNATKEQIKAIFSRINKTDYALNAAERSHAQWGESEFVCFAKQVIDTEFDPEKTNFVFPDEDRKILLSFFHGEVDSDEPIFSANDMSRMLAYQYIMALVATMVAGEYFHRNEKVDHYIKEYNENFPQASELLSRLIKTIKFIKEMRLKRNSRWLNKANLFTLIVELDKIEISFVDVAHFSERLNKLDHNASVNELGFVPDEHEKLSANEQRYFDFAREAVNQKSARIFRGGFIQKIISDASLL